MRVPKLFRSSKFRGIFIGLLCAALCWWLNGFRVVRNLENWSLDICHLLRAQHSGPTKIVIIAIDDKSLESHHKPLMFITPELAEVVHHVVG